MTTNRSRVVSSCAREVYGGGSVNYLRRFTSHAASALIIIYCLALTFETKKKNNKNKSTNNRTRKTHLDAILLARFSRRSRNGVFEGQKTGDRSGSHRTGRRGDKPPQCRNFIEWPAVRSFLFI